MTIATVSSQTWTPILEGELAARAEAAVDAVAEAITKGPLPDRNQGSNVSAGEAGIALLFEYLDRARPGAGYGEIAQQRLERAIDLLGATTQIPGLFSGFTGVSWTVEHLIGGAVAAPAEEAEAEEEDEDPNEDVDKALLDMLSLSPWDKDYDLISGLVGFGVYALERLPRPSAATCLERLVERLAETSTPRPGGITWHTPFHLVPVPNQPHYPNGLDNLGVAHGTPGVIALLARIATSGVAEERARGLLADAVSWLLAQKLPAGEVSVYPYTVGTGFRIRPARTAWCYGDPGIALALLLAGRSVGEAAWEREALDLAGIVARRPPENCRVEDAGLCHGAAGLGHLLNRLYQATGEPELLASARAWFGRTLEFWEPGRGVGGFQAFIPPPDNFDDLVWSDDAGFLSGSVGVALPLLAATSGVDPAWDRLLLVSPVPAESAL